MGRVARVKIHAAVTAALAACSLAGEAAFAQLSTRNNSNERQIVMAKDWASGKCVGTERLAGLDGKTAKELEVTLGEPTRKSSFRMSEKQDEFHITLQNHYPLKKRQNAKIEIQEWTWEVRDCRLTVWLHKPDADWLALENLRYNAETEF
jgi:hypothetical protein